MDKLAAHLHAAADQITTVDRTLPALTVPETTFGTDGAGLPGRVGRRLHSHWTAVLAARAREAATAAHRLTELATAVRATDADYTQTDESVADRMSRESP